MMQPRFVIQIGDQHVRIAQPSHAQDGSMHVVADFSHTATLLPRTIQDVSALAQQMESIAASQLPLRSSGRLIVPASWCLIHEVQISAELQRDANLAFEFERFAPVRIDELTCALWRTDESTAYVIAVFTEPMQAILAAIERSGHIVECATPDLCVLNDSLESGSDTSAGLLYLDERQASILLRYGTERPSRVVRSFRVADEHPIEHVRHHIGLTVEMLGLPTVHWRLMAIGTRWTQGDLNRVVSDDGLAVHRLGSEDAAGYLLELADQKNPLNLRVGDLQSSRRWRPLLHQLCRCAAMAAVLLTVVTVRLGFDASRYAKAAGDLQMVQDKLYQAVFPGSPALPGSALRLQSERIKLEGLTQGGGARLRPTGMDAFTLLHDLTTRLPQQAKINIQEITLEPDGVRVVGSTTDHQVAGNWVKQLNANSTLQADPPHSKLRADSTVEFRVHVKRAEHAEDSESR